MDILLLHGYNVTSTDTYGILPKRLKSLGHRVRDVYIGKYVTLDNDLTLPDLVRAFHSALLDLYGSKLGSSKFACLTHSTGALLVRGWMTAYVPEILPSLPITHLIMLAPPNHGSRLASLGKSRLSRLRSLWGVEPGLSVLDALELGSAFQWNLDSHWISKKFDRWAGFFPFVITGQWIDKNIWDTIIPATYERGSDGVVRACAANLNLNKVTVHFSGATDETGITKVPYLIAPQTSHSDERFGIMQSIGERKDDTVFGSIVEALNVKDRRMYEKLGRDFERRTQLLQKNEPYHDGSPLDRYSQLVIRVRDQEGNSLPDYAIELLTKNGNGENLPPGFFADQHKNQTAPEFFIYYLNYDHLLTVPGECLEISVNSVPHSPLVRYAPVYLKGEVTNVDRLLKPNQTTYVEAILGRELNKRVFQLTPDLSPQKIDRKPGKDWIS